MTTSKPPANLKSAGEIMTTRLTTISPEMDVAAAIRTMVKQNVSGMPVVDDSGQYVGVFSEKSSLRALTHVAAQLQQNGQQSARAADFMVTRLVTLSPDADVFTAIGELLRHRVSGAPVVDQDRLLLGVFSEKDSMNVLLKGAYDQLPGAEVSAFMNTDPGRIITEETDLLTIAQMFVSTSYRRLPVVRGGILQGQISRRDVLRNSRLLASIVRDVVAYAQSHASAERDVDATGTHEGSEAARAELSATRVVRFVDSEARTITEDIDLLSIAQIFSATPFRRLPVLRDGRLVGQVSRRDVLSAVYDLIKPGTSDRPLSVLYLSGVLRDGDAAPEIQ